jgi:hypothetical protein
MRGPIEGKSQQSAVTLPPKDAVAKQERPGALPGKPAVLGIRRPTCTFVPV